MRAVIAGAGASGLLCAGGLAEAGHDVVVIEKNERVGKKLFITGKGRCNLTNACDVREFLENVVSNPKFMNSSVYGFSPSDTVGFFESLGVKLKVERGNRVFPVSDKSGDIVKALERYATRSGANIRLNERAISVKTENGRVESVVTDRGEYPCDVMVVATGGVTYSSTGSTGDGYAIAKKAGHTVKPPTAGLVPLLAKGVDGLAGLSLKNVGVSLVVDGKSVASQFGEMLFTHTGVSGPVVLTASSLAGKYFDEKGATKGKAVLEIDLKPALNAETLDARLVREISSAPKSAVRTMLFTLMPKSLAPCVLNQSGIDGDKKCCDVSKKERESIAKAIKALSFVVTGKDRADLGIITQGGIDVSEIDPKTMESRLVGGLYFIGEVLDVDALTGGFNLQIAFSTAKAVVRDLS